MAAGKFSCDGCGKSYSWKPELAGRRVKCKCGQAMSVPATDPAAAAADDLPDGFADFAALGDGAPSGRHDDDGAHAAVAAPPARAKGGAAKCPTCGRAIDAGAVICVGCGTNLKTGKKLKTQKDGGGGGGAAGRSAAEVMPGYRSYGAVATDEPMSPQKKKMIMLSSIGLLVLIIGVIVAVIVPKAMENRRRTAELDAANPGELGAALSAMEQAGGLTESIKDGSLAQAVATANPQPTKPRKPPYWAIQERHERLNADPLTKIGKKWINTPDNHFYARTRDESVKLMTDLYGFGVTSAKVFNTSPSESGKGEQAGGILAVLPTEPDARKKIFAWYEALGKTIEPDDLPSQTDMGQKYLSIEFAGS
jgi:type II secretory pathway pseudopilin PulG